MDVEWVVKCNNKIDKVSCEDIKYIDVFFTSPNASAYKAIYQI